LQHPGNPPTADPRRTSGPPEQNQSNLFSLLRNSSKVAENRIFVSHFRRFLRVFTANRRVCARHFTQKSAFQAQKINPNANFHAIFPYCGFNQSTLFIPNISPSVAEPAHLIDFFLRPQ